MEEHKKMQKQWLIDNISKLPKSFVYKQAKALGIYDSIVSLIGEPTEADSIVKNQTIIQSEYKKGCSGCRRNKQ